MSEKRSRRTVVREMLELNVDRIKLLKALNVGFGKECGVVSWARVTGSQARVQRKQRSQNRKDLIKKPKQFFFRNLTTHNILQVKKHYCGTGTTDFFLIGAFFLSS